MTYKEQAMFSKLQRIVVYGLVLVVLANCGASFRLSSGPIRISEVVPCREVTSGGQCAEVISTFPAGTDRVYVFFRLEGPAAVPLQFKWFREGVMLGAPEQRVEPGLRYAWLATGKSESLAPGSYRIEIVMGGVVSGETSFVVLLK